MTTKKGRIKWIGVASITASIGYHVDNVPLRVYVDGKEVYHGRSACVTTESVGSSSRVDTKTGPWCLFPKEYFAGHDVVIKTEKSDF
jgi:hypothetical protein